MLKKLYRLLILFFFFLEGNILFSMVKNENGSIFKNKEFALPELWLTQQIEETYPLRNFINSNLLKDFESLKEESGGNWIILIDRITGKPAILEGKGIEWLKNFKESQKEDTLEFLVQKAFDFLEKYNYLFEVDTKDLVLNKIASGPILDYLYFLHFDWTYKGIPVEGAQIIFRLNHGNLVQVGQEYISSKIKEIDLNPKISQEDAWQILWGYLDLREEKEKVKREGKLVIIPVSTENVLKGNLVSLGEGLNYKLVYFLSFKLEENEGNWEAIVDAKSGEILSFRDTNIYGRVRGGVYPTNQPAIEENHTMPYADIGGGNFADSSGLFNGLNATSSLKGKYVGITDNCGSISLSTSNGDLNFSSGGGTNCATPGVGGAGNTRAARTTYHWATQGKIKALHYYPSNSWLSQQLSCNTNINAYCNASWDGTSLNFQRAGSGCFNTGELPSVILHEYGHGFDSNDGIRIFNKGSSEVYADFTATSILHDSCIFRGLYSTNGNGYGDPNLDCNGARELDWAKHQSGMPHTPEDLLSNSCPGCTRYACNRVNYGGPCGFEEHCEALIMGEALWDLATRDLVSSGLDLPTAWQITENLFWSTRSTTNMAYNCPSVFSSNGCGITNYFSAFRVADDCDGDLSNGTPHSLAIFNAFERHKVACPYFVNIDQTDCCPHFSPNPTNLTGLKGHNSSTLYWNPVSNATSYNILRNEIGCDAGFFKIGNVGAQAQNFVDPSAANDITFYYRIQPVGDTQACGGMLSNCIALTPQSCAGSLSLNKSSYSCNDTITFTLKDGDLTGQGSKQIIVWSDTETTPENVTLTENPSNSGYFTGTFPTTANPPVNGDGKISISNGDTITARYADSSFCGTPRNIDIKAKANCGGLIISGVQVLEISGTSAKIIWTTNRASTSLVKYDTVKPPVSYSKSDSSKVIKHSLILDNLSPCTTYYFEVSSQDEAGNTVTDNNGGLYYKFTTGKKNILTYTSTQAISPPDGSPSGAESIISIPESRIILDVDVNINYEGLGEEDLTIYLKGPDGTQVMLVDRRGIRLEENMLNTTFDDEADYPVKEGFPPFGGSCQPEDPLRSFKGKNTQGNWTLKVVDNYRQGTGTLTSWSLKISCFNEQCNPSFGTIDFLDDFYGCSSIARIALSDSDLSGAGSIIVNVSSSTESQPETITLFENPSNSGKFYGSISLANIPTMNGDGKLSVRHGDNLLTFYLDNGILREGNAIVDCQPPTISDFKIESLTFDIVQVSWKTDKPSNSKLSYGSTIPPSFSIQDLEHYTTYHKFILEGLSPCTSYYLSISSTDLMGNISTDNNSGHYYTFKTLGVNYLLGPDDVEGGQGSWTVSQGSGSFWHIDQCRSYSGNKSWKAGASDYPSCSAGYQTGSETYLISPVLDFGSDGGVHIRYREFMETNVSDIFAGDYGRPLLRNPGGSWESWTYFYAGKAGPWRLKDYIFIDYLGNYYTGLKQVSLVFKSDFTAESPPLEGWYVDDISVYKDYPCMPELFVQEKNIIDVCSGSGSGGGNGKIDPGEDITLQITLKNKGSQRASNVYAILSTNTEGLSILQDTAFFGDIDGFGSKTSLSPHFIFRVEESVSCGKPIYFNLQIFSDEGNWEIALYFSVPNPCNICDSSLKVNVFPDSLTICTGEEVQLKANVAGAIGNVYYQWTRDGQDIPGATNSTYNVSYSTAQTHNFNCKVRDNFSSNITDPNDSIIQWQNCSPLLSYDESYHPISNLFEICGDGDGIVEPGEKWQASLKIKNSGGADATNVYVNISINPSSPVSAQIIGSPVYLSTISKNSSKAGSFIFIVSPSASCVNPIIFDISSIQSDQGFFEGKTSAFSVPVGASGSELRTQPAHSTIYASNSYQIYSFEVPFTLPSVSSATLSFNLNYNSSISMSSNFSPVMDAWVDQLNPNFNGGTDTVMHVQRRNGQARRSLVQFDLSSIPSGSTINSATLYLYATSAPTSSQQLDVHRNQGSWTETGVNWNNKPAIGAIDASTTGGTSTGWKSWNVLSLVQGWVSGSFPNYGVQIKCNNEGNNTTYNYQFAARENSDSTIRPYLNVNYIVNTGGNITQNVKVELISPSGRATVIKNYGDPVQSSYNIAPYYSGPGIYKIKLSENKGGIASLYSASMSISLSAQTECNVSSCSGSISPPPMGDGRNQTTAIKLTKLTGNQIKATWDSVKCSSDHAVILYGTIGNWGSYTGAPDGCNLGSNGTDGAVFSTSLTNLWFNIIWVNSGGAGGHPGFNSAGQKRNLNAAGLCGVSSDDHSDSICD